MGQDDTWRLCWCVNLPSQYALFLAGFARTPIKDHQYKIFVSPHGTATHYEIAAYPGMIHSDELARIAL